MCSLVAYITRKRGEARRGVHSHSLFLSNHCISGVVIPLESPWVTIFYHQNPRGESLWTGLASVVYTERQKVKDGVRDTQAQRETSRRTTDSKTETQQHIQTDRHRDRERETHSHRKETDRQTEQYRRLWPAITKSRHSHSQGPP